jgi:hypothetical protein
LGKSKQQKESEALAVENQRQTIAANKWKDEFSRELARISKERFAKEQAYLEENVDPALKGFMRTGFAPGEEKRLRAQENERASRIYKQQTKTTLGNMARGGFRGDQPSGAVARARTALGAAGAEQRVTGQRAISQYGADQRRAAVEMGMRRAGLAPGQSTMQGSFNPIQQAQQAKFAKGGWSKFGSVMKGVGDFVTKMNPLSVG